MARKVKQIRFYGDNKAGQDKNWPNDLASNHLRSGSAFSKYTPIKQLGIQTMPGVKFYLNNSVEPIIVGSTGIYELNVENMTDITALYFDATSINMINNTPSLSYIIVDILYEE